jgi:hypothetical protein
VAISDWSMIRLHFNTRFVAAPTNTGFAFGGDVLRLFHGDECLTIPAHDVETAQRYLLTYLLASLMNLLVKLFVW